MAVSYVNHVTREQGQENRDKKLREAFSDLAPVWLLNEEYHPQEDSFSFNLIYTHPVHGGINEHCKYDIVSDVLYPLGESRVSEETLLQLQDQEPFIASIGEAIVPLNPANRL